MQNTPEKEDQATPSDQTHPFILAALNNEIEEVRQFLTHGTPDYVSHGITPLWAAAQNGHFEIARLLIDAGADVNYKHPIGQSVLWTAAAEGHSNIVQLLLSKGAHKDEIANNVTPLWVAVQNNHIDTVQILIGAGCDVNLPHQPTNQTAIRKATLEGNEIMVSELINAKADVNLPDNEGTTPLMASAECGNINIINALLLAGAKVNAVSKTGKTALTFAYREKANSIAERLLQAGANTDIGYARLEQQFTSYLDSIRKIFPDKYNLADIEEIKTELKAGLCYGFSLLLVALPENYWEGLYANLKRISEWDGREVILPRVAGHLVKEI
ncbi:MAG: ankyrin repeat domain-containing protein [Legionella sp.]|jgi:ankyrin repeat protein